MSGDYSFLESTKKFVANRRNDPLLKYGGDLSLLEYEYLIHNGVSTLAGLPLVARQVVTALREKEKAAGPSLLVGVEVEVERYRVVEDVDTPLAYWQDLYWVEHEDGSLRNNGREFVTRLGMTTALLPQALNILSTVMGVKTGGKVEVNARTGLHVHINVSNLSVYELSNLLFIYALIEPLIFEVSGDREQSIFCVPWEFNRSTIGHVLQNLGRTCETGRYDGEYGFRWRNYSKYCGLNISTVETYGTIEFRMHHGTLDQKAILRWVGTLQRLYNYAKNTDLLANIQKFRTDRQDYKYWPMISTIFEEYLDILEPKKAEHITRCKHATLSFFKHFIDQSKLPAALTTVQDNAPKYNWREVGVDLAAMNFEPVRLVLPNDPPPRQPRPARPRPAALVQRVAELDAEIARQRDNLLNRVNAVRQGQPARDAEANLNAAVARLNWPDGFFGPGPGQQQEEIE